MQNVSGEVVEVFVLITECVVSLHVLLLVRLSVFCKLCNDDLCKQKLNQVL